MEKIGGLTVAELEERMSWDEMVRWLAHLKLSNEETEAAIAAAKAKGGQK